MSVASEITRLQDVKSDILQAISDKGVEVPVGSALDDCPDLIASISGGGSHYEILSYLTNSATGNNSGIDITEIESINPELGLDITFTPKNNPPSYVTGIAFGEFKDSSVYLFDNLTTMGAGYNPNGAIYFNMVGAGGASSAFTQTTILVNRKCRVKTGFQNKDAVIADFNYNTGLFSNFNLSNMKAPTKITFFKNTQTIDFIRIHAFNMCGVSYRPAKNENNEYGFLDQFGNFTAGIGLTGA